MRSGEHIVLESDVRDLPRMNGPRKVHASVQCRSALRRRRLALTIIDYYYLAVRAARRGSADREYVLDLRFVDPRFMMSRTVPWHCIWAALPLTTAAIVGSVWLATGTVSSPRLPAALVVTGLIAATALAYLWVGIRLVEAVALHSLHGRAALLEYRGGLGTFRRLRPFLRKLAAHVQLAAADRRSTRAAHLRDELREHHRLKEDGVLSVAAYDASRARILAQHCATGASPVVPVRPPVMRRVPVLRGIEAGANSRAVVAED